MSLTFLTVPILLSGQTLIAMALCCTAVAVLYRRVRTIDRVVRSLGVAVIGALVLIIATGLTHFNPHLAFDFPAGAFHLDGAFFAGLGAGMLISAYDYWGYYNVCFMAAEVRNPRKTIPFAVLGSVTLAGVLYMGMHFSVLGVIPWREMAAMDGETRRYTMAVFMQRAYGPGLLGHTAAMGIVMLVALTAGSSVLALLLGYSRIPYAAAHSGNFPAIFGRVHPKYHIPHISLLTLAGVTLVCCLFRLQEVITTLVVIRIMFQFLLQGFGRAPAPPSRGAQARRVQDAALSPAGADRALRVPVHPVLAPIFCADAHRSSDSRSRSRWSIACASPATQNQPSRRNLRATPLLNQLVRDQFSL